MIIAKKKFFCSWSGGKDSCLALHYAVRQGGVPACLLTMMIENGERSRSHGLTLELLQAQAERLNLPLIARATSWDEYEKTFSDELKKLSGTGIEYGIFGDIDLEEHRGWCRRVCADNGLEASHPLWQINRRKLIFDFLDSGFKAIIVAVRDGGLTRRSARKNA